MPDDYPKIGDDVVASVYELIILEHVEFVNPKDFKIKAEHVDPRDYFITSGDAVEKAKVLERDLWRLAGKLRRRMVGEIKVCRKCSDKKALRLYRQGTRPMKTRSLSNYEKAIWRAAGQARKFVNVLKAVKAENCFLETEWENHKLLCIPKNPRR